MRKLFFFQPPGKKDINNLTFEIVDDWNNYFRMKGDDINKSQSLPEYLKTEFVKRDVRILKVNCYETPPINYLYKIYYRDGTSILKRLLL